MAQEGGEAVILNNRMFEPKEPRKLDRRVEQPPVHDDTNPAFVGLVIGVVLVAVGVVFLVGTVTICVLAWNALKAVLP